MPHFLALASHYHANSVDSVMPLSRLPELSELTDVTGTIQLSDQPLRLPNTPVMHRPDGDQQATILNARQVLIGALSVRLHPHAELLVAEITDAADFPLAQLMYAVIQPAQVFAEIEQLLHIAYGDTQATALLKKHILEQRTDQPVTTEHLVSLCAGRVGKSSINALKSKLGFTKAKETVRGDATAGDLS